MKIRFFCSCGKEYLVGADKAGKKTKCVSCTGTLTVPNQSEENIVVRCSHCQKLFEVFPYLLKKETECPNCGDHVFAIPEGKEEDQYLYADGDLDQENYSYEFKDPENLDQKYCNFCRVEVEEDEEICHSCGQKTKARKYNMESTLPKIGKNSVRQARQKEHQERQKQRPSAPKNSPTSSDSPTQKTPSPTTPPAPNLPKRKSASTMRRKRFR